MTEPVIAAFVTERVKEAPKLLDYIWESKAVRNARWEAILAKLRDLRDGHVAAVAHNKQVPDARAACEAAIGMATGEESEYRRLHNGVYFLALIVSI